MALIQCDFFSDTLGMCMSMNVIMPQSCKRQIGMASNEDTSRKPAVLYLLHGLSDDHTIWSRRTSIERYVAGMPLAVVMPNVHRSFYTDMVHGADYWKYISEEIPAIVQSMFNVSDKREDTFVAGLSMGGYGAFKLGMLKPEMFAAAASLSGVVGEEWITNSCRKAHMGDEWYRVFGSVEEFSKSENSLSLAHEKMMKTAKELPKFYQCCGTSDFLYKDNLEFKKVMENSSLDYTYEESAGVHSWDFWDVYIQKVLKWLPIEK